MPQTRKSPGADSGAQSGTATAATATTIVASTADIIRTRHARRIRLHHVLVRRRRWSKALGCILIPADPWSRAVRRG